MEQVYNYIKVAIRSLFKFRSDAILNVIGLSVGITISLVVFMYVRYQLAYDKSYENSHNTYRVITKGNISGNSFESALTPTPLSSFLRENFSEVITSTKIVRGANKLVSYHDLKFNEDNFFYADSTFFEVFDVPFVKGDIKNPLKEDDDVVITTSIAEKYFADEDPIGKVLKLDNGLVFNISAVCESQPINSHFHFDFIASQQSIKKLYVGKNMQEAESFKDNWLKIDWYTYFVLNPKANSSKVEEKIQNELKKSVKRQIDYFTNHGEGTIRGIRSLSFHIQALENIHLHSNLENELETNSKHLYVVLFLSLAIFVLLITCINFMNLTTARASLRIKEIGVRKLIGSTRKSLMIQLVVEAITYSFVALFIGLVLVELLLPVFNMVFELNLKLNRVEGRFDLLYVLVLTFLVGISSGLYPAIAFSGINEVNIFREGFQPNKKGLFVRGILATTQMMVATFLIILSLGMFWQIQFLKNKDLGYNSNNIIVVERGYSIGNKFDQFKDELKTISGIENVSACSILPGQKTSQESFSYTGKDGDQIILIPFNYVEKDFFKTLGVKFESGGIWEGNAKKRTPDLLINRRAKEYLEMNKPLGQKMQFAGNQKHQSQFTIKGVFKDFHFEPIQLPIRPLILMDIPKDIYYSNLLIKVSPKANVHRVITEAHGKWNNFTDNDPFEYKMLNDSLANNLKEESLVLNITVVFMILSLLIAWLGLRAFAAFVGEMKDKEFKSKKIIGASSLQIFTELFMSISQFVLPGILISIPIAFIVLKIWLNGFAYYSQLPLFVMIAISAVVWGISFLLVLLHSGKSVKASPSHLS